MPDAQPSSPLDGNFQADGSTIRGLDELADGTWVFVVVRLVEGGPLVLATSATGRAFRDGAVEAEVPYQYRVVAQRDAAVGPNQSRVVRSFPSEAGEGKAFDSRPPRPPRGVGAWDAAAGVVRINWPTAGLPAGLNVLVQRADLGGQLWRTLGDWLPAAAGSFEDGDVSPRQKYLYRLRARDALGKVSKFEFAFGPIEIP